MSTTPGFNEGEGYSEGKPPHQEDGRTRASAAREVMGAMSDARDSRPAHFDHSLSERDPQAFKGVVLNHLGRRSAQGALVWNHLVDTGVVVPSRFTLNPRDWRSYSRGAGDIQLGTKPMDQATKERLLFQDSSFTYLDEITYKLNHEDAHGLYFLSQGTGPTRDLVTLVNAVRRSTDGKAGLTALGSYYSGQDRVIEDATELMAMHTWSPDYLREYLQFLEDPKFESIRAARGLITTRDADLISELVRASVEQSLRTNSR